MFGFFFFFNVANIAYLGGQEMMEVVKRDNETIKEHLSKVITLVLQESTSLGRILTEDERLKLVQISVRPQGLDSDRVLHLVKINALLECCIESK